MKSRAIHTFITLFLVVSLLLPVIAEKDTQQENPDPTINETPVSPRQNLTLMLRLGLLPQLQRFLPWRKVQHFLPCLQWNSLLPVLILLNPNLSREF